MTRDKHDNDILRSTQSIASSLKSINRNLEKMTSEVKKFRLSQSNEPVIFMNGEPVDMDDFTDVAEEDN